jgi:NMD protein affecting ribosome stability and mRNA decay
MQPYGTQGERCNRCAAYSSPSQWVRKLATGFPDLAAQMPEPSRLPLYPMANRRDVLIYREKHTPRIKQGGRAHAR